MAARIPLLIALVLTASACAFVPLPSVGIGVRVQVRAQGRQRASRVQLTLDWRPRAEPPHGRADDRDAQPAGGEPLDGRTDDRDAQQPVHVASAPSRALDAALDAWERGARREALLALTAASETKAATSTGVRR